MGTLILIIIIFIILAAIGGAKEQARKGVSDSIYYKKQVLGIKEQSLYWLLLKAAGTEKIVLCQVAFSQIIKVKGRNERSNQSKFARSRQKVADFVICEKDFSIKAIVELDDSTHNPEKDRLRDEITKEAGITTYRYKATNLPSLETVMEIMK